jgi:hypothetical protein
MSKARIKRWRAEEEIAHLRGSSVVGLATLPVLASSNPPAPRAPIVDEIASPALVIPLSETLKPQKQELPALLNQEVASEMAEANRRKFLQLSLEQTSEKNNQRDVSTFLTKFSSNVSKQIISQSGSNGQVHVPISRSSKRKGSQPPQNNKRRKVEAAEALHPLPPTKKSSTISGAQNPLDRKLTSRGASGLSNKFFPSRKIYTSFFETRVKRNFAKLLTTIETTAHANIPALSEKEPLENTTITSSSGEKQVAAGSPSTKALLLSYLQKGKYEDEVKK